MKLTIPRLSKKMLAGIAVSAVALGFVSASAWSPDRPTYTVEQPAPHVTFNSITNNADYGDERTFYDVKDAANTNAGGFVDKANVQDEQELLLRIYVHNNAADNLNTVPDGQGGFKGISKDTKVRIHLPTATAKALRSNAYITSSNSYPRDNDGNPIAFADTVDFAADKAFSLEYVPGSAVIYTNAKPDGMPLSDSIVTTGAPIGYDQLNGIVPGCFKYTAYVNINVKVKMVDYSVEKKVRLNGTPTFTENVTAKPGDKVDFAISFKNDGPHQLDDVTIGDALPEGLTYVPGTTELNSSITGNKWEKADSDNITSGGVRIGDHAPGAASHVRFTAQVAANDQLPKCGLNQLLNRGFAKPHDNPIVEDDATVEVPKECKETPAYSCDLLKVEKFGNRQVRVTDFRTSQSNGATFSRVEINWGDNTAPFKGNVATGQTHSYAQDGTYNIVATAYFTVDGQEKSATAKACEASVNYGTTPTPETPRELPRTGAGSVAGIFAATTIGGALAHSLVSRKRQG